MSAGAAHFSRVPRLDRLVYAKDASGDWVAQVTRAKDAKSGVEG
jgi:hypothetical protein